MKKSPPLCIYHGNCADGFASACVVKHYYNLHHKSFIEFYAGVHQESPPNVQDRDVIFVDFSYKRPVIIEMAKQVKSILILDHHISAAKNLVDLPPNVITEFDMGHSGAVITWKYYFPNHQIPTLLLHIEDRDLWKFSMPGTREISAALFAYEYDFDIWMDFIFGDEYYLMELRKEGRILERKHFKDINEFIKVAKHRMEIAGHDVPVLNAAYFWSSDAGHIMGKNEPFAACYWFTPDGVVFSLRSAEDGLDVSEIAKRFGGGGHAHAAGFRVPVNYFVKNFLPKDHNADWERLAKSFLTKG